MNVTGDERPALEMVGIRREFDGGVAVEDLDLTVHRGQFVTLLGPSGCGKTTTLRMMAGYLEPTAGKVVIDGVDATRVPPRRRNIGMVFQSYALFPHLSVRANVAFGLQMRRTPAAQARRRVDEALELVGLAHLGDRRPAQLSGGQQQRVALARAVVVRPSVLLLDEPLSNLDARMRVQMREELVRIQAETGLTAVLVTHDQEEAMAVADHMVLMQAGRVAQTGSPQEVFERPASRFVAEFLGYENFLDLPGTGAVTVRPEHVAVHRRGEASPTAAGDVVLPATVQRSTYRGTTTTVVVEVAGAAADLLHGTAPTPLAAGEAVDVVLPARTLVPLATGSAGATTPEEITA